MANYVLKYYLWWIYATEMQSALKKIPTHLISNRFRALN